MFQGQLDTPLDDVGRGQAEAVAPVLATLASAVLLTSDLSRARATVAPLERATGTTATPDARLRELDLGAWQGLTAPVALDLFPDEHAAWRAGIDVRRGGGEHVGGGAGPQQVAAEQQVGGRGGDVRGGVGRLLAADLVERGVDLALDAPAGVVAGPAVPHEQHPAALPGQGATVVRPTARSASRSVNGMTGQSFHSRSRA